MRHLLIKRLLILLPILFPGCQKKLEEKEVAYPVVVSSSKTMDVPFVLRAIGRLESSLTVEIHPQITGILTEVPVTGGSRVEEDELLATIDNRPWVASLEEARSRLKEAEARLQYATSSAKAYGSLVDKSYVARLDFEQTQQNQSVLEATVQGSQAEVTKAEIDLNHTQIRAPFTGYVGKIRYDAGNLITPQNELTTIRCVTPLHLLFSLPYEWVDEVRQRQGQSPLYLEAKSRGICLLGELHSIDNTVDPETGMIAMTGVIPNDEELGWPGQFARVFLHLKVIENATVVPASAVVIGEQSQIVFVVEEKNRVRMQRVETGIDHDEFVVVLSGIKPGEIVVTDGQINLYDGAHVKIATESAP